MPTVSVVSRGKQGIYTLVVNASESNYTNYTITLEEGLLTYGVKQLFIIADNKTATYGDAEKELTATLRWDLNGAALTDAELTALESDLMPAGELIYELSRVIPEDTNNGKDAGTYVINVEGPEEIAGYAVNYYDGQYVINKKNLTLKAATKEKVYGEEDPALTLAEDVLPTPLPYGEDYNEVLSYTWTGFWAWLGTQPIYTIEREEGEDVGEYEINVGLQPWFNADMLKNYTVTVDNRYNTLNGTTGRYNYRYFYITKRPMTVKVADIAKYYGQVDPVFGVEFEEQTTGRGLVVREETTGSWWNPQTIEVADEIDPRDWEITRERPIENRNGEDVKEGGYQINIAHAKMRQNGRLVDTNYNPNYEISVEGGTLTINKAVLNVKAVDQGIEYAKDINQTYLTLSDGSKKYAYTWAIDSYEDEDGNTLYKGAIGDTQGATATGVANPAVQVAERVGDGVYTWTSLNDNIEDIISLDTEKTKVGVHKPADAPYTYTLTALGERNYEINFTQGYLTIKPLNTIPLNDAELAEMLDNPRSLTQVLDDHQNAKVNVVLNKDRQFRKDQWYTLVLPFDIRVRDLSSALGYAVADTMDLKNAKEANLKLDITVGTIPANTPFIVKVDETIPAGHKPAQNAQADLYMGDVVFEGKTIAEFEYLANDGVVSVTDQGGNTFYGTYAGKDNVLTTEYAIAEGPDYPVIVNGKDARGQFYQGYSNRTWPLAQTEAYWIPTEGSSAPVRITVQEPDGTYTAISGVSADTLESEAGNAGAYGEGWYTISGVKLNAKPAVKGTYIFNGKKVLVK